MAESIAGISLLVNPEHVRPGVDMGAVERGVLGRAKIASKTAALEPGAREARQARHQAAAADREYRALLNDVGLDELEDGGSVPSRRGSVGRPTARPGLGVGSHEPLPHPRRRASSSDESDVSGDSSASSGSSGSGSSGSGSSGSGSSGSRSSSGSESSGSGSSSSRSIASSARASQILSGLNRELGVRFGRKHRSRVHPVDDYGTRHRSTEEHSRSRQISDAIHGMRGERVVGAAHGLDALRLKDAKVAKLEEIAALTQILKDDRVDVTGISHPSTASSLEDIESALRALRLKNDRNRFTSLGEELMMGAAEFIESVFDGGTEIPVLGWKPDYTGYRNTVQTKLMRMRFETSQIVASVVQGYDMGPASRILLELIPSLLLYPSQNRRAAATPGLYDTIDSGGDDRMRSSMGAIRSANSSNDLSAAADL